LEEDLGVVEADLEVRLTPNASPNVNNERRSEKPEA
jgi:hypothetical protein